MLSYLVLECNIDIKKGLEYEFIEPNAKKLLIEYQSIIDLKESLDHSLPNHNTPKKSLKV